MPRLTNALPKYRKHRASGQAVVTLDGKDFYLGPHGSKASKAEGGRLVGEWQANGRRLRAGPAAGDLTIKELVARWWVHAESYYRKGGQLTSEVNAYRLALRPLVKLYGHTQVSNFGPLSLRAVANAMIEAGVVRTSINKHLSRIRHLFKWGVENEIVPPAVLHGLQAVSGLRAGRTGAKESAPVRPVPDDVVEAILPFLSEQVSAMVRLQLACGARPGEVVAMRGCDLNTGGETWTYTPPSHKTQHHGHGHAIYLGPKAQAALRPLLRPDLLTGYVFNPREAEAARRAKMHAARKVPAGYGNRPGTNRVRRPKRTAGKCYDVASYRRAVHRACDKAFPAPADLTAGLDPEAEHRRRVHAVMGRVLTDPTAFRLARRLARQLAHAPPGTTPMAFVRSDPQAAAVAGLLEARMEQLEATEAIPREPRT